MKAVIVEETFNADVKKVWIALTEKAQMKKWYFDLSDFKAEPGFEFTFSGKGSKGELFVHLCKVTEVIPLKKIQYSWEYENREGYSTVTFELFEINKGTTVKVTHTGLDSFPKGHPDFAPESFQKGWNSLIREALRGYLENTNNVER